MIDLKTLLPILKKLLTSKVTYLVALVLLCLSLLYQLNETRNQAKRVQENQETLLDSVKHYKTSDSLHAAQASLLTLNSFEFNKFKSQLRDEMKTLKSDKVNSVSSLTTTNHYLVREILKDSLVRDTVRDTVYLVKTINYKTKWNTVTGFINVDTINLSIYNYESLALYRSYQRKKFLGIKLPKSIFGYKKETIDVISRNPNTVIGNVEVIDIK